MGCYELYPEEPGLISKVFFSGDNDDDLFNDHQEMEPVLRQQRPRNHLGVDGAGQWRHRPAAQPQFVQQRLQVWRLETRSINVYIFEQIEANIQFSSQVAEKVKHTFLRM